MTYQKDLAKKVNQTIKKYDMLKKGDKVLVCVSGGPDSVAMLYILNLLKKEYNLTLHIAHLNHMIRRLDSQKDAFYVKRAANRLKIPVTIETKDVPKLINQIKGSPEETARTVRYNFFQRVARQISADKIATAHTLDDQAETVLMRLIKGAGTGGLRGIPPKRRLDANITIIRPLIETQKDDILKFLKTKKIRPRQDISNLKLIYFRNKIRKELIPLLERYNPNIKQTLSRISQIINDDYEYLEGLNNNAFKKTCQIIENTDIKLDIRHYLKYPPALQKGILRKAIKTIKGNLQKITYEHWQQLDELIKERRVDSVVNLPDDIKAIKKPNTILLTFNLSSKTLQSASVSKIVNIPGKTAISNFKKNITTKILKGPIKLKRIKSKDTEYIDLDKITMPVVVRTKRCGDRIKPLGMDGYKKLQDLFVDEKIPVHKRDKILVLEAGGKIIWVVGSRISDEVKLTKKTKKILQFTMK